MSIFANNPRARFDYEILETFEAGIELTGGEVKSVRSGHLSLNGSFAIPEENGIVLLNMSITPYQPQNAGKAVARDRRRRLLMGRDELRYLVGKIREQGLTLIPMRVYPKGRYIKVELGLGRHKKSADKRETIRRREAEREVRRVLKREE